MAPGRASASAAYAPALQVFLGADGSAAAPPGSFTIIARKEFVVQEITASAASRDVLRAALERVVPDL